MSRLKINLYKICTSRTDGFLEQRWSGTLLTASALVALIITLYPYDYYFANAGSTRFLRFEQELRQSDFWHDAWQNVLLFVPFGFALSCFFYRKGLRTLPLLGVALLFGAGLSAGIEFTQIFLPARQPAVRDIISNVIGSMVGAITPGWIRRQILRTLSGFAGKFKTFISVKKLFIAIVVYFIVIFGIAIQFQHGLKPNNWDAKFPLLLGNERSGDRPWRGHISELSITAREMTKDEVSLLFSTGKMPASFRNDLLMSFRIGEDGHVIDKTGQKPELKWRVRGATAAKGGQVRLGPDHWLQTAEPVSFLTDRIEQSAQFTFVVSLATANVEQTGPARIVSISDSPGARNLTLGQSGSDLIVRLRTPMTGENGTLPGMVFPDVLADTLDHKLVITYKPPFLRVYTDGPEPVYTAALTPDMIFIRHVIPVRRWRLHIDVTTFWIWAFLNYTFMFLPLAFFLALILVADHGRPATTMMLGVGSILVFSLVFEEIAVGWHDLRLENILLSATIITAAIYVFKRWAEWLLPACGLSSDR